MKRIIAVFALFLCITVNNQKVQAQKNISIDNIANIKVDELSDDQIKQFSVELRNSGYSMDQFEKMAMQKNMPRNEFAKLKSRLERLDASAASSNAVQGFDRSYQGANDANDKSGKVFKALEKNIFGSELFSSTNLTFEPNLKIATPANYQLGPDDELIIDVYGYSEATFKLKVSPEGYIRVPNVGPIQVSGNTIETARKKIIAQLTSIYSGINTGETMVNITLGSIRSIKVVILGEVNLPGTYTLPSLATVFNALYASGGPNKNGSFRNIKVIRNGKVIAVVDVYDFLLKGESKGNIRLADQDMIKVSAYENRIELKGEVKRPAYYEVVKNETLKDVIGYAGGFTDEAYRERIKVVRNTSKEKSVADIPSEMFGLFYPSSGDVYEVGKVLERFSNRVIVKGAVFRPGYYALDAGLTVSKLIEKAEGLREDAFMSRAILYRLKEDNSLELINLDLNEVLKGKGDIALKREDVLEINSKLALKERYTLIVKGEVMRPGEYPFAANAKVEDLIVAAGGLKENASLKKIEIARRVQGNDFVGSMETAKIINYEIDPQLKTNSDLILEPFDIITVYAVPGYTAQRMLTVEGEVMYPGQYSLSNKKERVSDIIKRSGGLSSTAYVDGAFLVRTRKLSPAEQIIWRQKMDALEKEAKDSIRLKEIIDKEVANLTSIVGINLSKILKNPGSKDDLILEDGDVISIPSQKQTIKVSGEILYPIRIPYRSGKRFSWYLRGAGGYTEKALRRRSYVVYANGSVKSTRNFILFNWHPKIKPGSEIIVPPKQERRKVSAVELVSVTSGLSTVALLIYTILNSTTSK